MSQAHLLAQAIKETPVARPGMTVETGFSLIAEHGLPGIPFFDANNQLAGRLSVKHVLTTHCIPGDVRRHAHLLGDFLDSLRIQPSQLRAMMALPVDGFIIPAIPSISPASPLVKALALMEEYNSSYVFVMDGEEYRGMILLEDLAGFALERSREEDA